MLVSNRTRHFKFVVLLLALSLAGCREDEAKTASAAAFNDISISVERLSDIHAATHICELAAAISLKSPSKSEECSSRPAAMAEELENEFLNAFQKNPACKGITLIVGTDDPARLATPEEQQKLAHRLGFTSSDEFAKEYRDARGAVHALYERHIQKASG